MEGPVLAVARKRQVWVRALCIASSIALLVALCERWPTSRNVAVLEAETEPRVQHHTRALLVHGDGQGSNGWADLQSLIPIDPVAKLYLTTGFDDKARCLDGTSGAFYFSPSSTGSKNWIIVQEWGGWCTVDVPLGKIDDEHTVDNCYTRSLSYKGTSSHLPQTKPALGGAYLSRSPVDNPTMHDWNMVYVHNCDGTSFVGRLEEPLLLDGEAGPKEIYIRGAYIREAISGMLQQQHALDQAENVVIGGLSAGGLATLLHINWWGKQLATSHVMGLVDSGFFLEWQVAHNGTHSHQHYVQSYRDQMRLLFQRFNGSVDAACERHWQAARAWECMFASNLWPFVEHELFIRQSIFDSWQLVQELGSTADAAAANSYGRNLSQAVRDFVLKAFVASGGSLVHSAFLDACFHHCGFWRMKVAGVSANAALGQWVAVRMRGTSPRVLDTARSSSSSDGGSSTSTSTSPSTSSRLPKIYEQKGVYPCAECCSNDPG